MSSSNPWHNVLATHMEEQVLASGPWLGNSFPGVALPFTRALGKWVEIGYKSFSTIAQVVDVGPWCIDDVEYVAGTAKPRAEVHKGRYCPREIGSLALATVPDGKGGSIGMAVCNGAGIDLMPRTAKQLGIKINDNVEVQWRFIDLSIPSEEEL